MELKFRAFNGKDMVPCGVSMGLFGDVRAIFDGYNRWYTTNFPIMQFTGLKDKNGKDIYAGDSVYLAGYGFYTCEFPFIELYEAGAEGDIGAISHNIHQGIPCLGE